MTNVKIDGKHTEWPQPLRAFNKAIVCAYTIANDEKNLYLAINSSRWGKIQSGGITLVIDGAEITYPYNRMRDRRLKENRGRIKAGQPRNISDFKEIRIKNINGINDTLISIYNSQGIKVLIGEYTNKDYKKFFNYEIAIPLKLIRKKEGKNVFNYKIILNGIVPMSPTGAHLTPDPNRTAKETMEIQEEMNDLERVSQLSGKYTLATKP
jgi:hypothetical protein